MIEVTDSFRPDNCPGVSNIVRPVPEYLKCPNCGGTMEMWSDEDFGKCDECGHEYPKALKDASCLAWCPHADKCKEMIQQKKMS